MHACQYLQHQLNCLTSHVPSLVNADTIVLSLAVSTLLRRLSTCLLLMNADMTVASMLASMLCASLCLSPQVVGMKVVSMFSHSLLATASASITSKRIMLVCALRELFVLPFDARGTCVGILGYCSASLEQVADCKLLTAILRSWKDQLWLDLGQQLETLRFRCSVHLPRHAVGAVLQPRSHCSADLCLLWRREIASQTVQALAKRSSVRVEFRPCSSPCDRRTVSDISEGCNGRQDRSTL